MSNLTLYEISNQFKALETLANAEELPHEMIGDTLEGLDGEFEAKAIAIAKFVLSLEASAATVYAQADLMHARAHRIESRAASIKAYLQFWMEALRKRKVETPELTVRLQANPATVVVTNEHAIPARFWVEPEPPPKRLDKKALKEALEAGALIDGAYVAKGEHLRIVV